MLLVVCRRVAKRAYKTLSKLVGKMVPGYKPPYVSASISGPVDAEHAAAVDDQAGTGAGRAGASDKALDNAAPEQPMTEQHPEPKAETVSTVGQGAAPESMESVERVLDDILAAAVGSVEEATPTHQQAEEQMAVAYGAATAGIADSVRSEVKKRKAEAEVRREAASSVLGSSICYLFIRRCICEVHSIWISSDDTTDQSSPCTSLCSLRFSLRTKGAGLQSSQHPRSMQLHRVVHPGVSPCRTAVVLAHMQYAIHFKLSAAQATHARQTCPSGWQ
jgi:hypothetical protein